MDLSMQMLGEWRHGIQFSKFLRVTSYYEIAVLITLTFEFQEESPRL